MKNLFMAMAIFTFLIPIEGFSWCFIRDDGQNPMCNGNRIPVTIRSLEIGAATDGNTFTPHIAEKAFLRKLPPKEIPGKFSWGCSTYNDDKLKCLKRGTHIKYNKNCKSKSSNWCKQNYGSGWVCREHYYSDAWRSSCFKKK